MIPPGNGPERIDLAGEDDRRDAVHRAVACLAQGGIVAMPSEGRMILAASALNPFAVERLHLLKGKTPAAPLSLGVRSPDELDDWLPGVSKAARKLARRAWPGPVTLLVTGEVGEGFARRLDPRVRAIVAPGETLGMRRPDHEIIREVLDLVSGPLVITCATSSSLESPELHMRIDDGVCDDRVRNTVVMIEGSSWSVVREGAIPVASLKKMVGTVVLFVCTGNTCRSPMAEALCRLILAETLGCRPDEVADRGFVVESAGLAAGRGGRAATDAMAVVQDRGGSLRGHISRQVGHDLIAGADLILPMTRDHRDALLDEFPDAKPKIRLLHARDGDIEDPIGCDLDTYRRTASDIESHIKAMLDDILSLS